MNSIVRGTQQMMQPGQQDGGWIWNGASWVCDSGCPGTGAPPWCPPPGFPPPGCPPWFSGMNSPPWYPGANAGVSFGTSPPPNPVRGHFWWDGSILWMFDGAAWVVTGGESSGGVTPPSTTAPANPAPGQQWFNGATLFVWDGNAWVPVSQTKTYVQPTAPPAPNPGDQWFDGTQMRVWSGSAWMLVGPGATVGPFATTTQVFAITVPTALSVITTGWEVTPFTATPIVDTMNGYDSSSKRWTPNRPGVYFSLLNTVYNLTNGQAAARGVIRNDSGTVSGGAPSDWVTNDEVYATAAGTQSGWINASGMKTMNGTTDFLRHWSYDISGVFPNNANIPVWQVWAMP